MVVAQEKYSSITLRCVSTIGYDQATCYLNVHSFALLKQRVAT